MKPPAPEQAVFAEALQRASPEARVAYLDGACGTDRALRDRVEALLRAAEDAGDFLEQPPTGLGGEDGSAPLPGELREKPGDRIGRFKLLEKIGEGGCGVVYMAEQEAPVRRRVALKVIKPGMDTRSVIARFEAERQALALMDHPNIAKVFDGGATPTGRPYFVMELVRGVRITEFCDEARLPTEARLRLFIEVCQAIQHAHQKGIIHRDLKPSNILVTVNDGAAVPKVIDFGIAKATGQRLTDKTLFTQFHSFIGTPAYTSPEQAEMSSVDVDTRSDIYSLGVLLYELLTSRTPFDGEELLRSGLDEMRRTIRETDPARPSTRLDTMANADLTEVAGRRQSDPHRLVGQVQGDLDWIVMKAMEKDRARRYGTATGLAADVQRHLDDEPVTAGPPDRWYRLQKMVRRNRLVIVAGAALAATVLLALVFLVASNVRTLRERDQKDLALKAEAVALAQARASEQNAKEQLFASLQDQARARRFSGQRGQRLESLAALAEASLIRVDAGLRNEAIAAMALPDVRLGPVCRLWRTNCVALASDPTGLLYAWLDHRGALSVRRIGDDHEIRRFETGPVGANAYTGLSFSPDGRFLVKAGDGQQSMVWSVDSGAELLKDGPQGASAPTFSSNHALLALATWEEVLIFDLATGRERNRWRTAGHIHSLQFHPTDNRIAVGYKDWPWVSVYDGTDGRDIAQLAVGEGWRMVVGWHPQGKQLAVGSTALGIQIWDVETPRRVARLESQAHQVDFLTFHPSGKWLASWSWDGVICLWEPTTGRQALEIPLLVANLRFGQDGRWLGHFWPAEDHAQLLEFVSPDEYTTLLNNSGGDRISHNSCAVSPDDRFLAVAMDDGVHLWNLQDDREVGWLPTGHVETVVFEPTGKALWTCSTNSGLQRWALGPPGNNEREPIFAPPERIELPFAPLRLASDRAGQTLALLSQRDGRVVLLDVATKSTRLLPVRDSSADFIAISADAKWLATSGWHSDRAQLWNIESSELVKDWVVGLETRVAFTPDSRELILERGSEFQFLKIGMLETTRRLPREIGLYPGTVAFSPDGELMAMEIAPAVIHVKEVSTGRTVAQLEDPFRDRSNLISFTHEGTRLIVLSAFNSAIHVWDLRAIRSRLKSMELDVDRPKPSKSMVKAATSNARGPTGNLTGIPVTAGPSQSSATKTPHAGQ